MKKCKGCGIELQHKDREGVGYVADLKQDYCQRCFRLLHYGDTSHFKTNYVTNEKITKIFQKYSNELSYTSFLMFIYKRFSKVFT